ncbi:MULTISPECIES: MEKHLA domain-containing protein [Methylomicrobium]|uniref:MEKHLA domain-containing protein n=1 Tax=Methylomicrobium album BG8 TaxID=686340 RepID=H8GNU7_METAL|nr:MULTISPECIES: MEKHLA domain-containing protein [Methylomicrobium]EIC30853.1 MEKHLA domain-containing protein [Methylomicrobium album BG8]
MDYPSEENCYQASHAGLIIQSYQLLLGRELIPGISADPNSAETLFRAPIAVISHDTAPDPVFNYANLQALALFEMSWEEFTRMPSRFSAAQAEWAEREKLLTSVKAHGFVYPLQGVRASKTGKRFEVHDGAVWNLIDAGRQYRGQAACFFAWESL